MAARSNTERQVRFHHIRVASASSNMETTPVIADDRIKQVSASQAQILKMSAIMYSMSLSLTLLACKELIMSFVEALRPGRACCCHNLKLKDNSDFKIAISTIKSFPWKSTVAEKGSEVHLSPVPSTSIPTQMLNTIPITIRDVLKCKRCYTSIDAKTLLVPLADVPQACIASRTSHNQQKLYRMFTFSSKAEACGSSQAGSRHAKIADVLLSIYQCECQTFSYMAHVILTAQQSHKQKQAIAEMDSSTAYIVFDFKQKFHSETAIRRRVATVPRHFRSRRTST
eukprot:Em0001g3185a